jgi:hypothetical protein
MAVEAFEKVSAKRVLREMQDAAIPAAKDFLTAAGGYMVSEYTVRTLVPKAHPLLAGLLQGALGLAGVVVGRQARAGWLETFGFGYGLAGGVRIVSHLIQTLKEVSNG